MHTKSDQQTYSLIDSGHGSKLEQFGPYLIARPCAQAVWDPQLTEAEWEKADASFTREGENKWIKKRAIPNSWNITVSDIVFKISSTDFGHLGIFPEQRSSWEWIQQIVKKAKTRKTINILNLFAYSGGSTLAAAKAGAHVCHLDASKGMVAWARENALLNGLEGAPIRWIVDDCNKFLTRELKRGVRYDGIILDPPSFGRGSRGEVFKIEDDLPAILRDCRSLLSEQPLFVLFSCHTPGFSPIVLHHLTAQMMRGLKGSIETGEMLLQGSENVLPLPNGVYARWTDGK
jgi:23S rRNA (cytosine1962-C5)-methyltransferase